MPVSHKSLSTIEQLQAVFDTWDSEHQEAVQLLRQSIEQLHADALKQMITPLKESQEAAGILKKVITENALVYTVLRYHDIIKPSLSELVEQALASVRPFLHQHGGDVELVDIVPPDTVYIKLQGQCNGCPASSITLSQGIEKAIHETCPQITTIKTVNASPLQPSESAHARFS